jgi:hypothetical protein
MPLRKHEGFRVSKRTKIVEFEPDSEWHGIEVEVRISVPFKTLIWMQGVTTGGDQSAIIDTYKMFAEDFLIEWNIQDEDGVPYPATADGIMLVDSDLVNAIVEKWVEAVVNVPTKSSDGLKGGGLSGEELMGTLASSSVSLGN